MNIEIIHLLHKSLDYLTKIQSFLGKSSKDATSVTFFGRLEFFKKTKKKPNMYRQNTKIMNESNKFIESTKNKTIKKAKQMTE